MSLRDREGNENRIFRAGAGVVCDFQRNLPVRGVPPPSQSASGPPLRTGVQGALPPAGARGVPAHSFSPQGGPQARRTNSVWMSGKYMAYCSNL